MINDRPDTSDRLKDSFRNSIKRPKFVFFFPFSDSILKWKYHIKLKRWHAAAFVSS